MKADTHDVGIIVGRFQVPELHQAHRDLIQSVCNEHDKVIIFLGASPLKGTRENPLDFEARKQMLLDEFDHVNVLYINDRYSDEVWSKDLDSKILDLITPGQRPLLYGGRDSFIKHYAGKFKTLELEPDTYVSFSGTDLRRQISRNRTKAHPAFREGATWSAYARYASAIPTVDIAVFNETYNKLLLAKKPGEDQWRLIGGFAEPNSGSFTQDARREVAEEAHIEITDPECVDSFLIDDWRYRNEADKIKTTLFVAKIFSGSPTPDDDIEELKWFRIDDLSVERDIVPNHRQLVKAAIIHTT